MSKAITNGQVDQLIHTAINKAREQGFLWFIRHIFSFSFDKFIDGDFLRTVAEHHDNYDWTMAISARDHFKSTRFYAEVMYEIFTTQKDIEAHYFSYQGGMSKYHIAKIKKMIENNPFFPENMFIDLTKDAQGTIRMSNAYGATYSLTPQGLLSFKRGIHADRIYVDDPLKDPENKLAPTAVLKINGIIKTELIAMVKEGGKCRIVGTPQTNSDFFFDPELNTRFNTTIRPAIINEANKEVIFPEWKSYEKLCDIRNTIGEKVFNQEYMCVPSYSEDSFIERKKLQACVDTELANQRAYGGEYDVVGGMDLGKKAHPSHIALYERRRDNATGKWKYKQLLSKWLDHVEYRQQLEIVKGLCEDFNVVKLRYDNTRAEFEAFAEQGLLPRCMEAVVFGMRKNQEMAVSFETVVNEQRCSLINDSRQIDQILQVNSELQAVESPMGHGDSFWSNALALYEPKEATYRIRGF